MVIQDKDQCSANLPHFNSLHLVAETILEHFFLYHRYNNLEVFQYLAYKNS